MTAILDSNGRPAQFSTFEPIATTLNKDRRLRGFNKGGLSSSDALPQGDRYKVIAWLRSKYHSNSIVASIVHRYAIGIGYASPRVNTIDTDFNDAKERYLEGKMDSMQWGSHNSMESLAYISNVEEALTGECYRVKMANGKIRIVAAELIGSPDKGKRDGEIDGIIYGNSGQPLEYRVGKRDDKGRISYDDKDATFIVADNVWRTGQLSRAEELRPFPKLAPAIKDIYDITQISDAKIEAIKISAAYALMITKHTDPSVFASLMENGDQNFINQAVQASYARSEIKDMGSILYGEVGEDAKVLQPSIQAQDFNLFHFDMVGRIANTLGITPEEAIAGYGKSNYSSSRADKLRWKQVIDSERRKNLKWLNDYQAWQVNRGRLDGSFELPDPDGSTGQRIEWTWPHVPEIDESKSAAASISLYSSGLGSKTEAAAKRGRFVDEVINEQVNEAYMIAKKIKQKTGDASEPTADEISAQMPTGLDRATALKTLNESQQVVDN